MSKFQKRYLCNLAICVIGSTVIAAAFWSNDFTFTRLALNTIQSFVYAWIWTWLGFKFEGWVFRMKPKQQAPKVKPDVKSVWPPVVDRKN